MIELLQCFSVWFIYKGIVASFVPLVCRNHLQGKKETFLGFDFIHSSLIFFSVFFPYRSYKRIFLHNSSVFLFL